MFPYSIIGGPQGETLTAILPDGPLVVQSDHPKFDDIVEGVKGDEDAENIRNLSDLSVAVAEKFDRLSERVQVAAGRVFFDNDEVHSSVTQQIVRCLETGLGDYRPLVAFMENIAANPNDHSREQLYDWLESHDFTITLDGKIVGYKGVERGPNGGYQSVHEGTAVVNGETVHGKVPNAVGNVVEMARSSVQHNPGAACSTGLHVGTYDYAKSWARGAMLRVLVDPRDVVSVPTDADGKKVRVCRYTVDAIIDAPETVPVYSPETNEDEPCEECGEPLDEVGECWNEDCIDY